MTFFWFILGYIVGALATILVIGLVSAIKTYNDTDDIQYEDRRQI